MKLRTDNRIQSVQWRGNTLEKQMNRISWAFGTITKEPNIHIIGASYEEERERRMKRKVIQINNGCTLPKFGERNL